MMVVHRIKHALWVVVVLGVIACAGKLAGDLDRVLVGRDKPTVSVSPIVSLENSVQKTIGSVVHVRNNTVRLQGSGVAIAPDIVLTARHVIEDSVDFEITTNDGKKYKATVAISSKKYDLGFIRLDEPVLTPAIFGSIENCRLGQQVFAIGSPYGEVNFNSVTLGIISSLQRELEKYDCPKDMGWSVTFQTDAAGHPGNSGCPVFTTDGVVRGILVGGFSNALVYCVPVDLIANDGAIVRLMFAVNEYRLEQVKDTRFDEMYQWFLNQRGDRRLDEMYQWIQNHREQAITQDTQIDNIQTQLDEIYEWFKNVTEAYP